jgi:excisionase family DNA binding protein
MAQAKITTEKLSSVKDLEARFKVSDKTIYRWVQSGQLEAIAAGRQLRFEESEVKHFMNARRRTRKRITHKASEM